MSKYVEDEPVDLVGGVEGFVNNNIAEPKKGIKKICTRNIVKNTFSKQNIKRCDRTIYTV